MFAIIRIALKDLRRRWRLAMMMAVLFSITFASYLALITYQKSLSSTYFSLNANWLVVQESFGSGEIHGSRLSTDVEQVLITYGYDHPIPEIHQVVGTSISNGIMMRGVRPEDLLKVSPFKLLSGRTLVPGDAPRLAMVGISLANRLKIKTGDIIEVDIKEGRIKNLTGRQTYSSKPFPEFLLKIINSDGLLNYIKKSRKK